jgi:hypothetical protein
MGRGFARGIGDSWAPGSLPPATGWGSGWGVMRGWGEGGMAGSRHSLGEEGTKRGRAGGVLRTEVRAPGDWVSGDWERPGIRHWRHLIGVSWEGFVFL